MVCAGNICRSPLAEQLFRARAREHGLPAEVHSAGTFAVNGHGMTPEAAALSLRYGGVEHPHQARQLTASLVESADLVLTATREQRSVVVALHPRAARYSYTLTQFARLLPTALPPWNVSDPLDERARQFETPEPATVRALIAEVSAMRGFSPPPENPDDDDVEDPYRQSRAVYERVGTRINSAVGSITAALASAAVRTQLVRRPSEDH